MSSFLVSHATIDVVLSLLDRAGSESFVRAFRPFTAPADPRDALDDLGRQLLLLNCEASGDDEADSKQYATDYTFARRNAPDGATLKQLDCLIYQLTEGETPGQRPIYRALERVRRELADRILAKDADYVAAPWGMPEA